MPSDYEEQNTEPLMKPCDTEMNSDNLFAGNRVDRNENKDDIGISEKQTILNCDIDDHSKASLGSKGEKSMLSMFESLSCKTQQGVETHAKPDLLHDTFTTMKWS